MKTMKAILGMVGLVMLLGCSGADKAKLDAQAQEAKAKATEQLKQAGTDAVDAAKTATVDVAKQAAEAAAAALVGEGAEKPKGSETVYVVKPGDTLGRIAAAELGDAQRYAEIAALNGLLNPNLILPDQSLKIPPK